MPRTKVVKNSRAPSENSRDMQYYKEIMERTDRMMEQDLAYVDQLEKNALDALRAVRGSFTLAVLGKTLHELKNASTFTDSSKRTRSSSCNRKRCTSFTEDEGYLTTGSNESKRTSRSHQRQPMSTAQKSKRMSRSLSRSNMSAQKGRSQRTPSRSRPPMTFGTITPKVKPNMPQVLLRRPKQGEVAVSLQGSPLMVSSVVSDQMANVNIPLPDGTLLSLQPQRGLRVSQIPELDTETKAQIQALRDNLNKMCMLVNRK